jgi:ParB/RepB/Spo0J family partition protein
MLCTGKLRHCFFGTYTAIIGLRFTEDCVRADGWDRPETLATLAESLNKNGQDSPIVVRANWSHDPFRPPYRVVVGFRRHAAMKLIGARWIRCCVRNLTDQEAAEVYLRESFLE